MKIWTKRKEMVKGENAKSYGLCSTCNDQGTVASDRSCHCTECHLTVRSNQPKFVKGPRANLRRKAPKNLILFVASNKRRGNSHQQRETALPTRLQHATAPSTITKSATGSSFAKVHVGDSTSTKVCHQPHDTFSGR